jgi:hypothetical protein
MTDIFTVINQYLADSRIINQTLKAHFGVDNLVRSYRHRLIPKSATVGNISYQMHGIGCRAVSGKLTIDFDLNETGEVVGFDAWRLLRYACDNHLSECAQWTLEGLQAELASLLSLGSIRKCNAAESSHLYEQVT